MRNFNKLPLILTALCVLGATPIFAELDGTWRGTGTGSCVVPDPTQITLMYPWQEWEGTVENGIFSGTWQDEKGYQGGFYGTITAISVTTAYCSGTWTWYDESQITLMGPFEMRFNYIIEECKGEWERNNTNESGTMKGERVD